jgi:protein subunit release factor B
MDEETDSYHIPESDDALLAECEVDTFRAGGPGGQHQNVTESGVRLRHRPTGLSVTCRQDRSQHQNKQTCLRRLRRRLLTLQQAPPERLPTQPPADVRERRLAEKARQAAKKRSRNAPAETDD